MRIDTPVKPKLECLRSDRSPSKAFFKESVMNNFVPLFFSLGPTEMVILLVIVLILFGGSRLPQLMKGMGEGIRNFKQGMNEDPDEKKPELPK
jgi:sec-independent protein translocase protein TatA